MTFKQLSLFLENRPSQLKQPCQILAEAGINIRTLSLADADQFGILRLIVADWAQAKRVLEEAGCAVRVDDVVGLEVPDERGGMARVLSVLEQGGHNVLYTYAFTFGTADRAVLFMRFEEPEAAIATLRAGGVQVLDPVQWLSQA
ncbi:MAG: amino acid-binding protein [Halorhodospira sp.]